MFLDKLGTLSIRGLPILTTSTAGQLIFRSEKQHSTIVATLCDDPFAATQAGPSPDMNLHTQSQLENTTQEIKTLFMIRSQRHGETEGSEEEEVGDQGKLCDLLGSEKAGEGAIPSF